MGKLQVQFLRNSFLNIETFLKVIFSITLSLLSFDRPWVVKNLGKTLERVYLNALCECEDRPVQNLKEFK